MLSGAFKFRAPLESKPELTTSVEFTGRLHVLIMFRDPKNIIIFDNGMRSAVVAEVKMNNTHAKPLPLLRAFAIFSAAPVHC